MSKQGKRFKWHQLCCFISKTTSGKSEGENDEDKNPSTSKPSVSIGGHILGSSGPGGISSTRTLSVAKGIEISCAANGSFYYWNDRQCGNVRALRYRPRGNNQWSRRCLDNNPDIIMLHNGVGYVCVGEDRFLQIDEEVLADGPIQIEASRSMHNSEADNRLFRIMDCNKNEHTAECHSYLLLLHLRSNLYVHVQGKNLVCGESGSGVIINDAPIQNTTFDRRDCSNSH